MLFRSAKPRLHGLRCIQDQKEGKLLLQDGALLFKPKYAKKYTRTLSQSQILSLSWELGVEDGEPDTDTDTDAAPVTLPYKKFGATHPIQLQVTSYLNGNLAIQMVTWESGDPEPWARISSLPWTWLPPNSTIPPGTCTSSKNQTAWAEQRRN